MAEELERDALRVGRGPPPLLRDRQTSRASSTRSLGFYANYHSQRFVKGRLVLRMQHAPSADALAALNRDFADIVVRGQIEVIGATPEEIADDDHVDLARLAFRFDRHGWARLRVLIDRLNGRAQ